MGASWTGAPSGIVTSFKRASQAITLCGKGFSTQFKKDLEGEGGCGLWFNFRPPSSTPSRMRGENGRYSEVSVTSVGP